MENKVFSKSADHFEKYCCLLPVLILVDIGCWRGYEDFLVLPDDKEAAHVLFEVCLLLNLVGHSLEVIEAMAISYPSFKLKFQSKVTHKMKGTDGHLRKYVTEVPLLYLRWRLQKK
jgi:hypothetical protein